MKVSEYLSAFSGDLCIVSHGENVYALDYSRLGSEDFDFGIYGQYEKKSFPESFDGDVADCFADNLFDFLTDDLVETYDVPINIVEEVCPLPYSEWYGYITGKGYPLPDWIKDVCYGLSGECSFENEDIREADDDEAKYIMRYMEV